jgi:hypothetical protein
VPTRRGRICGLVRADIAARGDAAISSDSAALWRLAWQASLPGKLSRSADGLVAAGAALSGREAARCAVHEPRQFHPWTVCPGAQSLANCVTPAKRADHAAVYQSCAHTYPRGGRVPACQTRRTARSASKRCGGRRVLSRCCVPHLKFCATPVTSLTSKLTARAPQHRTAHRAPPSSRLAAASYRKNLSL